MSSVRSRCSSICGYGHVSKGETGGVGPSPEIMEVFQASVSKGHAAMSDRSRCRGAPRAISEEFDELIVAVFHGQIAPRLPIPEGIIGDADQGRHRGKTEATALSLAGDDSSDILWGEAGIVAEEVYNFRNVLCPGMLSPELPVPQGVLRNPDSGCGPF